MRPKWTSNPSAHAGTLAAVLLCLAGCATPPPPARSVALPASAQPGAPSPLAVDKDALMPVNLFLNAGEHISLVHAELLTYLAQRLKDGHTFASVDQGVPRWPYTLDLRYRFGPKGGDTAIGIANALVAGGTIGIVPMVAPQVHTLEVEVYLGSQSLRKMKYEVEGTVAAGLFEPDVGKQQRQFVDRLVEQFLKEIRGAEVIPRVGDLKPQPAKPDGEIKT